MRWACSPRWRVLSEFERVSKLGGQRKQGRRCVIESAAAVPRTGDRRDGPPRLHLRPRRPPDAQADRECRPGRSIQGRTWHPARLRVDYHSTRASYLHLEPGCQGLDDGKLGGPPAATTTARRRRTRSAASHALPSRSTLSIANMLIFWRWRPHSKIGKACKTSVANTGP